MPATCARPSWRIEKSPDLGLGSEYRIRLAPFNIARVRVERRGPRAAFVHWVYVPPAFRGQGLGQLILQRVLRDADRAGVTLALIAKACGTLAQSPLERWYADNGFVPGRRVREGGRRMVRAPLGSRRLRVA